MRMNGGKPRDNIPTLEEALRKFARERGLGPKKREVGSNVRYADFANRRDDGKAAVSEHDPAFDDLFDGESDQIIALLDGIPRTLQDLERMAAAEEAFRKDFPDTTNIADTIEAQPDTDEEVVAFEAPTATLSLSRRR